PPRLRQTSAICQDGILLWWVSTLVDTFWSARDLTPLVAPFNRRRFSGLRLQGPVAGILALGNAKGSELFPMPRDLSPAVPVS
ncbi:hypothetical protein N7676_22690, partial [Stenotrophomonas sp. GD03993]|uniref:hypothetical protein n=1 Tax=Stenotrophomonas sp. GD03993 TaxID=2975416 RepID=UPI00244D2EB3